MPIKEPRKDMSTDLAIKDVAERTGIAAGTIRMWEQRYGFPAPERTSSGYRRYTEDDVDALRKVLALRHRGLSVPAAISRAQDTGGASDHPSIYAAVAGAGCDGAATDPQEGDARRAVEGDRARGARAGRGARSSSARSSKSASTGASSAATGASRCTPTRPRSSPTSPVACAIPTARRPRSRSRCDDALGNEWAVIIDAPGYAACLLAWEQPGVTEPGGPDDADRRFEAIWTIDPQATRRAAQVAARLVGRADAPFGERLQELLTDRPLALEEPAPALTALTNRMIAYLEAADGA